MGTTGPVIFVTCNKAAGKRIDLVLRPGPSHCMEIWKDSVQLASLGLLSPHFLRLIRALDPHCRGGWMWNPSSYSVSSSRLTQRCSQALPINPGMGSSVIQDTCVVRPVLLTPGDTGPCLGSSVIVTTWGGGLLAWGGWGLAVLLGIPQCLGWPCNQELHRTSVSHAKGESYSSGSHRPALFHPLSRAPKAQFAHPRPSRMNSILGGIIWTREPARLQKLPRHDCFQQGYCHPAISPPEASLPHPQFPLSHGSGGSPCELPEPALKASPPPPASPQIWLTFSRASSAYASSGG